MPAKVRPGQTLPCGFESPPIAEDSTPDWADAQVHESHFHLINYIQEGTDSLDFSKIMATEPASDTAGEREPAH